MSENKNEEVKVNTKAREILASRKQNKKISVAEFVGGYTKKSTDVAKKKYLDDVLYIRQYVPFNEKVGMAYAITQLSCLDKNQNVHVNSAKRYQLYIISLFQLYTNIEFADDDTVSQYDILDENNIINVVLARIPEGELSEYRGYTKMAYDDLMTNCYEPHAFITKKLADYFPKISTMVETITNKLADALKNVDIDKLKSEIQK